MKFVVFVIRICGFWLVIDGFSYKFGCFVLVCCLKRSGGRLMDKFLVCMVFVLFFVIDESWVVDYV